MDGPITVELLRCCDWSVHKFIEVNFSKLMDSNQSLRIDFGSSHYHVGEISCKIIDWIFFLSRWTLYNYSMQDVLIRRWSQQRRLLARDVTRGIQYCRTAIRWYISCILSQLCHLKKYQEIKKSKNPSYLLWRTFPRGSGWIAQLTEPCAYNSSTARYGANWYNN